MEKKDKQFNSNILLTNIKEKNKNESNNIFLNNKKKNVINNKKINSKNMINNSVIINNKSVTHSSINLIKTKKNKNTNLSLFKKNKSNENNKKKNNLNDLELNTLEYQLALKFDKRTYIQDYFSLLKKKHLILFTFLPTNDYNLLTIKISLFLLSFSLFFVINGFFFTDETMHNVFEDNGSFNFVYQIPFIIYSSLITYVINTILKSLSLSERKILDLKNIPKFQIC